jgi:hypothetical protein
MNFIKADVFPAITILMDQEVCMQLHKAKAVIWKLLKFNIENQCQNQDFFSLDSMLKIQDPCMLK